jgi:hypothetical protein
MGLDPGHLLDQIKSRGAGCYLIQLRFLCTDEDVGARSGEQPSR